MTRGSGEGLKVLQTHAVSAWRELAGSGGDWLRRYVRFYAMHRNTKSAIEVAQWVSQNTSDKATAAACWLECLKSAPDDAAVQQKVDGELRALITASPGETKLRIAFAESRILMQRYDAARSVLNQVVQYDDRKATAFARLAWIALLIDNDQTTGEQNSARATRLNSGSAEIRAIRGLAIAESGRPEDAIKVLSSIPNRQRTAASYLFEARAYMILGRESKARDLILEISQPGSVARLDPAERRMLVKLQDQLNVPSRHMTGV